MNTNERNECKSYASVKESAFAEGSVPDGYFGKRTNVSVSLVGSTVVFVAKCGYFRAGIPEVIDQYEALWMLEHHPSAKHFMFS